MAGSDCPGLCFGRVWLTFTLSFVLMPISRKFLTIWKQKEKCTAVITIILWLPRLGHITSVKTIYGNEVRAYDIDRTVCDIVRRKEEMDVQVFQTAMKGYMAGNQKNLHRLMAYAEALG
ncbi:hypothetical protein SAMN04487833_11579 [Sarcina sp. DSM 11001]|nr:hypothetical protein SAMN04487833_11579 [Sarcina sp. DSM 11001]